MMIGTAIFLLVNLVSFFPHLVIAQDEMAEVAFPCALEVRDVVELQVTRSREQTGPDVRPIKGTVRNDVTFEVTERNETGLVLAWKTDWDSIIDALGHRNLPSDVHWVAEALKQMADHKLLIQTDECGSPLELVNLDETVELFRGLLDHMLESLQVTNEERAAMESMVASLLAPEALMSRVLQDTNLYFMFTGGFFEVGVDYEYEETLPNPWGGPPIPGQVEFRVASVDHDAGEANVTYRQETDSNAVQSLMREFFKRAPNGEDALKEMEGYDMGIFSKAEYTMNLRTGLPKSVRFQRTARIGPGQRADRIEIITASHTSGKG